MPFDEFQIDGLAGPIGTADRIPERNLSALPGAVLRQVSPVGSVINRLFSDADPTPDPAYDAAALRADLFETPYWENRNSFVNARNRSQVEAIKARIDQERRDERTIADAGAAGVVASLAAGLIDPTILLPGGAIYRSVKGGVSVARTAGSVAAYGAVQGAASEAILQATQETRRPEDWVNSIATSAILSGILGAGAAALVSKGERVMLERALDELRTGAEPSAAPARPVVVQGDLSAAGADRRSGEVSDFVLNRVPGFDRVKAALSPTLRVGTSMLQESRRALGDLAVLAVRTADNERGIATARGGVSVEAEVMRVREQTLYRSLSELDRLFNEYKYGPEGSSVLQRARDRVDDALGKPGGEHMTRAEFHEEIGRAMRREDRHENPYVEAAAQHVREVVFKPLADRAIKAGLLPEDVTPKGALSYFMRVYNKTKIEADGPAFVARLVDWLKAEEAKKEAISSKLGDLVERRDAIVAATRNLDARLERADATIERLDARISERGMEAGAASARLGEVGARAGAIRDDMSELSEFVARMREELRDPELQERLSDLNRDIARLRREAGALSNEEIARVSKERIELHFGGRIKRAAQFVTGERTPPQPQPLISFFTDDGIWDPTGDAQNLAAGRPRNGRSYRGNTVMGLFGADTKVRGVDARKAKVPPGLFRTTRGGRGRGNTPDDWGQRLSDSFPAAFPERASAAEFYDVLDQALRGDLPHWWVESGAAYRGDLEMAADIEFANQLARDFDDMEIPQPKTRAEFVAAMDRLYGTESPIVPLLNEKLEAISRLDGAMRTREGLQEARASTRDLVQKAIADAKNEAQRLRPAAAREREAGIASGRSARRLGVLQERADLKARARDILTDARAAAQRDLDDLTARIETEIGAWDGNTAKEAKAALRARQKYEAERAGDGTGARLTMADDAVNRAVKRILGRGVRDDAELLARAEEWKDRILSTPDGRLPYDEASAAADGFALGDETLARTAPRGGLARRMSAIPDDVIEDYLDSNAERGVKAFLNTFLPDVALHEKFGSVDLTETFKRINEEANRLQRAAPDEAARVAIGKQAEADIRDLAAMRDRIRNTLNASFNAKHRTLARSAFLAKAWNTVTSLGSSAFASFPDVGGPVARWGMEHVFKDAWQPLVASLSKDMPGAAAMRDQLRAAGIGIEMFSAGRLQAMDEIGETYRPGTRFERGVEAGVQGFYIANGQSWWTDLTKHIAGTAAASGLLKTAKRVADGKATAKDIAKLAENGIEPEMAKVIWSEWSRPGAGEIVDGIMLPNLDRWQAAEARRLFESALMREVNIAVITPGQEKYFWMSRPLGGLLGQFKSFVAGANERIVIAGLQRRDAEVLQGVVFMIGLGAMSTAVVNTLAGRPLPERPQDWVKEAMERSGVLGWLSEANQLTAKATAGGVDIYRLIGADKPLTRNAATSAMGQLLGPSYSKLETVFKVTGAPFREDGWQARDTADARRLLPLQNLWALRRLLNEVEDGANRAMGIDPLDRS